MFLKYADEAIAVRGLNEMDHLVSDHVFEQVLNTNHPGIDFAQYIILPGCMKSDGTGFTWLEEREVAEAPAWLNTVAARPDRGRAADKEPVFSISLRGIFAKSERSGWLRVSRTTDSK
jgi:hypothetical protein